MLDGVKLGILTVEGAIFILGKWVFLGGISK